MNNHGLKGISFPMCARWEPRYLGFFLPQILQETGPQEWLLSPLPLGLRAGMAADSSVWTLHVPEGSVPLHSSTSFFPKQR